MTQKIIRAICTLGILIGMTASRAEFLSAASAAAGEMSVSLLEDYRRVVTPNNDGYNDEAYFGLSNPGDVTVSGKIYGMNSGKVADMRVETTSTSQTLIWNGKDSSGSPLPQGAYFYVISGGDTVLKGVIVLAK